MTLLIVKEVLYLSSLASEAISHEPIKSKVGFYSSLSKAIHVRFSTPDKSFNIFCNKQCRAMQNLNFWLLIFRSRIICFGLSMLKFILMQWILKYSSRNEMMHLKDRAKEMTFLFHYFMRDWNLSTSLGKISWRALVRMCSWSRNIKSISSNVVE